MVAKLQARQVFFHVDIVDVADFASFAAIKDDFLGDLAVAEVGFGTLLFVK